MFNSDIFANRPSFGIVGRIFISTDTKEFFRDTGTSWELIGGPGSGTITGSGAATQIAFWNSASTITGSNNLWYDSTNSYLGVNTNAPGNPLDVHGNLSSVAALNQTTATNNTLLSLLNSGTPLWRIGNFYTAGANDFGIFDVVNTLQQLTIVKATGQTFIGAKTTASGRLVVNSATSDAHLQIVGANAPSIRIDNAGSGGTQRFVFGLATATNNFIQGATAGEFCISTQSAGNMLFGMWQTINASEVMRITTSNNLLIASSVDTGEKLQVTGTSKFTNTINGTGAVFSSTLTANFLTATSTFGFTIGDLINTNRISFGNLANTFSLTNSINALCNLQAYDGLFFHRIGINATPAVAIQAAVSSGETFVTQLTTSDFVSSTSGTRILIGFGASTGNTYSEIRTNGSGGLTNTPLVLNANGGNLLIGTSTDGASKLRIVGLPTSSVGLSSGDVYSNVGILTIVP
jgi:hypothetical protein